MKYFLFIFFFSSVLGSANESNDEICVPEQEQITPIEAGAVLAAVEWSLKDKHSVEDFKAKVKGCILQWGLQSDPIVSECVKSAFLGFFKDGAGGLWDLGKTGIQESSRLVASSMPFGVQVMNFLEIETSQEKIQEMVEKWGPQAFEIAKGIKRFVSDQNFQNQVLSKILPILIGITSEISDQAYKASCEDIALGVCRLAGNMSFEVVTSVIVAALTAGVGVVPVYAKFMASLSQKAPKVAEVIEQFVKGMKKSKTDTSTDSPNLDKKNTSAEKANRLKSGRVSEEEFNDYKIKGRDLAQNADVIVGTDYRAEGLAEAHFIGKGEMGKNGKQAHAGNYTDDQIRRKWRVLREHGYKDDEIKKLLKKGVAGVEPHPPSTRYRDFLNNSDSQYAVNAIKNDVNLPRDVVLIDVKDRLPDSRDSSKDYHQTKYLDRMSVPPSAKKISADKILEDQKLNAVHSEVQEKIFQKLQTKLREGKLDGAELRTRVGNYVPNDPELIELEVKKLMEKRGIPPEYRSHFKWDKNYIWFDNTQPIPAQYAAGLGEDASEIAAAALTYVNEGIKKGRSIDEGFVYSTTQAVIKWAKNYTNARDYLKGGMDYDQMPDDLVDLCVGIVRDTLSEYGDAVQ